MTSSRLSLEEYEAGIRAADRMVLGRALTLIESMRQDDRHTASELLGRLLPSPPAGLRIAVSGVPGAGKSTFIERLGMRLLDQGHRVAVLAVDPSSIRSGGSILGDKTRMQDLSMDARAFIRPSPSAGTLGGVARRTREAIVVCEAAGFDVVLVETVGVGQSETEVVEMVDVFVALLLAGAGDDLQGMKRGILEVVDVLVFNKADGDRRAAAESAAAQTRRILELMPQKWGDWKVPVLSCSALTGDGVDAVWQDVKRLHAALDADGRLVALRRRQREDALWRAVDAEFVARLHDDPRLAAAIARTLEDVASDRLPPTRAAAELVQAALASAFIGAPTPD